MQPSKELDNSPGARKPLVEGTSSEVDGAGGSTNKYDAVQLGLIGTHLIKQTGVVLAELEHTQEQEMCTIMMELAGKGTAMQLKLHIQFGGIRSHLVDPAGRRLLAKSLGQIRLQHLWFSLKYGAYCKTSHVGDRSRTEKQKQEGREIEETATTEIQRCSCSGTRAKGTWRRGTLGVARSTLSVESRFQTMANARIGSENHDNIRMRSWCEASTNQKTG